METRRRAGPPRAPEAALAAALALGLAGCGDDALGGGPSGAGPGGASTGAGATGGGSGGAGNAASVGGAGADATGGGGSGGGDLGWPLDDSLPTPCDENPPDATGAAWTGWANLQHPPVQTLTAGATSMPLYGQVYAAGETDAVGAAPGWQADLVWGPLGTPPLADAGLGLGRCWSVVPAAFNVDAGNNDEYQASVAPGSRGLFGAYFRYRPAGGAYRYGDLDGSDDGVAAEQAAVLEVLPTSPRPLVVATLNLRCRLDDWEARRDLVVHALARIDPDLVAFQEDCADDTGVPQSFEVRARLVGFTRRGYEIVRSATHTATATGPNGEALSFEEGISVLSGARVLATGELALSYEHFPRAARWVDVDVAGHELRFYGTHFDYGADAADARAASANAIVATFPAGKEILVAGDLNAEPGELGVATLSGALTDAWALANPSDPGLTMPADAPTRRIDFVFASAGLAATLVGAKQLDESAAGTYLSDHRGVAVAY